MTLTVTGPKDEHHRSGYQPDKIDALIERTA
jgi:hypothetical protein